MAVSGFAMPWTGGFGGDAVLEKMLATRTVDITVVLHGKETRSRTLSAPSESSCKDLKGHFAVNGVAINGVVGSGLEVSLEEGGAALEDEVRLTLEEGQVLHLRPPVEKVSVTAFVSSGANVSGEEEAYLLVVPAEVTGAALREHIAQSTDGTLVAAAVLVAQDDGTTREVGDDEVMHLEDDQAIMVQRAAPPADVPAPPPAPPSSGFMSSMLARLRGKKNDQSSSGNGFRVRCATNIRVKGSKVSCTTTRPWESLAVFDVPDPAFFEIAVRLLRDAPSEEAEGAAAPQEAAKVCPSEELRRSRKSRVNSPSRPRKGVACSCRVATS
eukprot:TRINITY_DN10487_c0_g1_i1.p1 TRINITY_DN10487_c0_g1~~TRINITY_DN10487_c0_g1_i1.p1  ORF type:complete len:327 (-),score=78.70 TRINITY_DN10487_c0_g1_i1:481-1461(-)